MQRHSETQRHTCFSCLNCVTMRNITDHHMRIMLLYFRMVPPAAS